GVNYETFTVIGREGMQLCIPSPESSNKWDLLGTVDLLSRPNQLKGGGEVRMGHHASAPYFNATIEPMHGNQLVLYVAPSDGSNNFTRIVLDTTLEEGHALACGDLLGLGRDQIGVGWRGAANNKLARVGIKMFVPDEQG